MALLLSWLLCPVPNLDWPLPLAHEHPDGFTCRWWQWDQHSPISRGFAMPALWPHVHPDGETCRWAIIIDNTFPW
jgi:hypothetical protein